MRAMTTATARRLVRKELDLEGRVKERLGIWRRKPVTFVRQALQVEPDPWQRECLVEMEQSRRIAIRSGHGVGKSSLLSWAILWFLTCHFPAKVPVTGSNFDQLRATLWAELALWLDKMPALFKNQWVYSAESLKYRAAPEQSFAAVRTASKERAQGLAGFHSKHVMVIIDEASAVDAAIFEVLRGALTSEGSRLLIAGNPHQRSGEFFRAFHDQRENYSTFHISCLDQARLGPGRVGQDWLDEQERLYGRDSNVFRVRVLGEFPSQDFDGTIPLDLVEAAAARDVKALDVAPVWGVDVARFGGDRTALAKRQGNAQLEPVRGRTGLDTEQIAGWLFTEWLDTPEPLRPSRINIDIIGLGAGVYDRLRREPRFRDLGQRPTVICAVNVAEASPSRDRFERLRDELWWQCREWFEARDCKICQDQALIGELTGPKYELRPNGRIKVEGKDDMKARGLKSPDLADAWIHTFAGAINTSYGTDEAVNMAPQPAVSSYDELWSGLR